MSTILLLIGGLTLFISTVLGTAYESGNVRKRVFEHKVHVMFPGHLALALVSFCISIYWFFTGKQMFSYGQFWTIVERGTFEALTSVMSIVGVGSILLGWIYGERDKLTLGKSQIEMIHYRYGLGYALSITIHFGATALAILMAECASKEAAFWAFVTVVWGCIPQMCICLQIAMNREQREMLALQLWKREGTASENKLDVAYKMAAYLSENEERKNPTYCETLGAVIKDWLLKCYEEENSARGVSQENIRAISAIFREISEKIPEREQDVFEEEFIKSICIHLDNDSSTSERKTMAVNLLSCGYFRYVYAKSNRTLDHRFDSTMHYYLQNDGYYKKCVDQLKDYYSGFEWFMFLNQLAGLPKNADKLSAENECIEVAFIQLVLSIMGKEVNNVEENARISWQQIYSGGEQG